VKSLNLAAKTAMANGDAIVLGAVKIEIPDGDVLRLWGGHGPLNLPGEGGPFLPLADRALAQVAGGALGGAAQAVTLGLSGIDPETVEVDDSDTARGAPTTMWRLIFGPTGQLLDYHVWQRGRLDQVVRDDEVGGTATITASLETAARGLGRRGSRMRSDADQRLVKANDGFFKNVSFAGEKTLHWAGRKPAVASAALGGSKGGSSAGGGFGGGLTGGSFGRGLE
jgi:hypothetical protein